jgi:hypothetical protein
VRVVWITTAQLDGSPARLNSPNATARYRILAPARELVRRGHEVEVFNARTSMQAARHAVGRADVVVFSKLLADPFKGSFESGAKLYDELRTSIGPRGPRMVMDVNDDHLDDAAFRDFYARSKPDAWVSATAELARLLQAEEFGTPHVIPDPYEGPEGTPAPPLPTRFPRLFRLLDRLSSQPMKGWRASILWFGHPLGLPSLAAVLPDVARATRDFPLHLHCLSIPSAGVEQLLLAGNAINPGHFSMGFEPWSTEATWAALRTCDLVLLPADLTMRKNRVKSANRLVEVLRAGRFAIAHPMPAYVELADYAYVGPSLADGIGWALGNPIKALERVRRGQQMITRHFSPDAVGQRWLALLQGEK